MAQTPASGYLPGDPRYGLSGESLRQYYREKPAQWMIIAWDAAGKANTRAARSAGQKDYARTLGERLIGYGHIVSDDASSSVLATTWFVQLDDRAAALTIVLWVTTTIVLLASVRPWRPRPLATNESPVAVASLPGNL